MAKIHYEADGPISAELFTTALTDFSERRPEIWPGLDEKFYKVHELGATWAEGIKPWRVPRHSASSCSSGRS